MVFCWFVVCVCVCVCMCVWVWVCVVCVCARARVWVGVLCVYFVFYVCMCACVCGALTWRGVLQELGTPILAYPDGYNPDPPVWNGVLAST
jgi:hypothetical protein